MICKDTLSPELMGKQKVTRESMANREQGKMIFNT